MSSSEIRYANGLNLAFLDELFECMPCSFPILSIFVVLLRQALGSRVVDEYQIYVVQIKISKRLLDTLDSGILAHHFRRHLTRYKQIFSLYLFLRNALPEHLSQFLLRSVHLCRVELSVAVLKCYSEYLWRLHKMATKSDLGYLSTVQHLKTPFECFR